MVWTPFLLRLFLLHEICQRGRGDTQGGGGVENLLGGPLSKRVPKNVIYCAIFKGSIFEISRPVKNILTRFSIVVNRIGMTCRFLLASS